MGPGLPLLGSVAAQTICRAPVHEREGRSPPLCTQSRRFSSPLQEFHYYFSKKLLFSNRITSEEYANQNKDDENSCNSHVLGAMQLCVVGGNGNWLEQ